MNIIAGQDSNDDTTIDNENSDYLTDIEQGIDGKKIGIIKEMTSDGLSPEVSAATKDAIQDFEKLGANCEEVSLPTIPYTVAAYYTITSTEAGSNLARYDNIRYGYDFESEGFEYNSSGLPPATKEEQEVVTKYGGDIILKGTTFSKYKQFVNNCFSILPGQALHAKTLGFFHPKSKKWVEFDSDFPDNFDKLISKWKNYAIHKKY